MSILGKLQFIIGAKTTELERGLDKSERRVSKYAQKVENSFGSAMKRVGGAIAGAFAVERITSFAAESIKLAGTFKTVEAAFNRLNRPTLLSEMRKATQGAVSDLELMQRAVSANNLGIPLNNMAKLLGFATKRARETGDSVTYLVNSIVTGIGRKSPLILDNLGLNARLVADEFERTGDMAQAVVNLIDAQMGPATKEITNAAIETARFTSNMENAKVQLGLLLQGDATNGLQAVNENLKGINDTLFLLNQQPKGKDSWLGKAFETAERSNPVFKVLSSVYSILSGTLSGISVNADKARESLTALSESQKGTTVQTEKEIKANEDLIAQYGLMYDLYLADAEKKTLAAADAKEKAAEAAKKWANELKELNKEIEKAAELIGVDLTKALDKIGREGTGDLLLGTNVQMSGSPFDESWGEITNEDLLNIDDTVNQNLTPSLADVGDQLNNIQNLGGMISNLFDDMAADDPFAAMIDSLKALILQLIQAAAIAAILSALTGGSFSAIFGGLAGLNFGKGKGVPAFAEGGITSGPTLAMVGDNPSGKEAIIPLEKMGQIFGNIGGPGGGGRLTATVSGTDLKFILDRTNEDFNRFN